MGDVQRQVGATLAVLLTAGVLLAPRCAIGDERVKWTHSDIALLFPKPAEGWDAEDIEVEEGNTIASGFEAMADGVAGSGAGVSTHLKVTRRYSAGEKRSVVYIDTEDIETAAYVDAIAAAFSTDEALRTDLENSGVTAITHQAYQGLSAQAGDKVGRIFKVGSAGIVAMECDHPACAKDLDAMIGRLDWPAIARFIRFDHRN